MSHFESPTHSLYFMGTKWIDLWAVYMMFTQGAAQPDASDCLKRGKVSSGDSIQSINKGIVIRDHIYSLVVLQIAFFQSGVSCVFLWIVTFRFTTFVLIA